MRTIRSLGGPFPVGAGSLTRPLRGEAYAQCMFPASQDSSNGISTHTGGLLFAKQDHGARRPRLGFSDPFFQCTTRLRMHQVKERTDPEIAFQLNPLAWFQRAVLVLRDQFVKPLEVVAVEANAQQSFRSRGREVVSVWAYQSSQDRSVAGGEHVDLGCHHLAPKHQFRGTTETVAGPRGFHNERNTTQGRPSGIGAGNGQSERLLRCREVRVGAH